MKPAPTYNTHQLLPISKQILLAECSVLRAKLRQQGKTLVFTNGCFDLLHAGHVIALEAAKRQGTVLWIGVNSDASIHALKGNDRPIYSQNERLYLLNALQCVDGLLLFEGTHCAQELSCIQPDVYVKSSDYSLATLHPQERQALESCHAKIFFLPMLLGRSTTQTIVQLRSLA